MEEENAQHTITVDAPRLGGLPLCHLDESENEGEEKQQHSGAANEAVLFAYGAEDEVGVLFWHVFQFGLCAVEKSLAGKSA